MNSLCKITGNSIFVNCRRFNYLLCRFYHWLHSIQILCKNEYKTQKVRSYQIHIKKQQGTIDSGNPRTCYFHWNELHGTNSSGPKLPVFDGIFDEQCNRIGRGTSMRAAQKRGKVKYLVRKYNFITLGGNWYSFTHVHTM